MAQYDEFGNVIEGDAFNMRAFNVNRNNGYTGQSVSPDYVSSLSGFAPDTNYGMSLAPVGSDISSIGAGTNSGGSWWDNLLKSGTKNGDGSINPNYAGMGLGLVRDIGNLYMGMKQYGLAKDQLAFGKESFNKNYNAQKATTNNSITSQNVARAASREGSSSPYKPLDLVV